MFPARGQRLLANDCENRITWMQQNYLNPNYAFVQFPQYATRHDLQRYLALCEGHCPDTNLSTFHPHCCKPASEDCAQRIQFMENNWNKGNFDNVNWPANPQRAHFQQYLSKCENKCAECPNFKWQPRCQSNEEPGKPIPCSRTGREFNKDLLRVMTWNTMAFCSQLPRELPPDFRDIRAVMGAADCKSQQPYDIIGFQETGDWGFNHMNLIMQDLPYMSYYEPGDGVSIAWNKERFTGTSDRGKVQVVDRDAYGPRFLVYIVLDEKATQRKFLVLNHHACIGCSPTQHEKVINQIEQLMKQRHSCAPGNLIPIFLCDCQNEFDLYRTPFQAMLTKCWGEFGVLRANAHSACGNVDYIYYPKRKLALIEQEKSFGSSKCGCSRCDLCMGHKDSDHASVLALFRIK
jgi:hypothetical protein